MNLEDRAWWEVLEHPFADFGSVRRPTPHCLGYFGGTRQQAIDAGRSMPGHDSWGDIEVRRVYLEDINRAILYTRSQFDQWSLTLDEQLAVRQAMIVEMGL